MSKADQGRISGDILEFVPRNGSSLDEIAPDLLHRSTSLPFEAGENRRAAVKIVDHRGIESLNVLPIDDREADRAGNA